MSASRTTETRRVVLVCLLLVAATLVAYQAVRDFPFVDFDDPGYVFQNEQVRRGLTVEGVNWALRTGQQSNWHPLTWLSHMLDSELFGVEWPGGHHLTSLLLHVLNSVLIFLVLRRMTGALGRSAFVAAIFALHPLHVESVVWVSERKDVLSALLGLLCIACYVEYARRGSLRWYGLSFVLLALGLTAKPMLVTLPFILLLLDYWPLQRAGQSGPDPGPTSMARRWAGLIVEKLPMFALITLSSWITVAVQTRGGAVGHDQPLLDRLGAAIVAYALYIDKFLRPVNLALLYPSHRGMWSAGQILGAATLLLALTALVIVLRRRRYLTVGWLWYLGTLVPVIGLVQFGRQFMADRYMYIPMTGLLIMLAWGAWELLAPTRAGRIVAAVGAAGAIGGCLWLTPAQVALWQDSHTLFSHALAVTERNDVAHQLLAHVLHRRGELDAAIEHYSQGLEINPNNAEAHYNLAGALKARGRPEASIRHYRQALFMDPDYRDAHSNLGGALAALGRYDEAVLHYEEALRIDPGYALGHYNLAGALIARGDLEQAIRHYREAVRLDPGFAAAHTNLALALVRNDDLAAAIVHFREVVRLRPDDAGARRNLARARSLLEAR